MFVLVTLGVGAAAVNTGNNLLYLVLGLLLSLIVLSGVLSEVVLRHIRLRRHPPARAFVGQPALVEIELRNDKTRASSYSVEIEDLVEEGGTDRRCYFLKVGPGATERATYPRVPTRRGVLVLTGFRVSTRYPFGLFEKSRIIEDRAELLVYPALVEEPGVRRRADGQGRDAPTPRVGPGTELAGLREYREGDEARAIHWRRTASLGRMVVRERQRDGARRLTLLVDNGRPPDADAAWDDAFEEAVGRAAYLAHDALEDGLAVEVWTRTDRSPAVLPGSTPDPLWRFLALLETVPLDAEAPRLDQPSVGEMRRFAVGAAERAA